MILDELTEFADNLDVSAAAGTEVIGDQIDMISGRDQGQFINLYWVINVTEDFTTGTTAEVSFELVTDSTAALSSPSVHLQSPAADTSALAAGTRYVYRLPLEGVEYQRYMGVRVVTTTGTTTAGSIDSFLTHDANGLWKAKPDAVK